MKRLELLMDSDEQKAWSESAAKEFWMALSWQTPPDPQERVDYLAELSCAEGRGGYIIAGIAQWTEIRAFSEEGKRFAEAIESRRLSETCPAAKHLREEMRGRLKAMAASGDGE